MTSINIALTLTLDVRLFDSSGRRLLTVRIEQFRCNGSTVGSQPDYEWNSPLQPITDSKALFTRR